LSCKVGLGFWTSESGFYMSRVRATTGMLRATTAILFWDDGKRL